MNKRGNILIMVLVFVAALSISVPYILRATAQVGKLTARMRAKHIAKTMNLSTIDLTDSLFEAGKLILDTSSPWRIRFQDPADAPDPAANWEFQEGTAALPSTLTFYSCDPSSIYPHGVVPTESECAAELNGYMTTVEFIAVSEMCAHIVGRVRTTAPGNNRIKDHTELTLFPTGKMGC